MRPQEHERNTKEFGRILPSRRVWKIDFYMSIFNWIFFNSSIRIRESEKANSKENFWCHSTILCRGGGFHSVKNLSGSCAFSLFFSLKSIELAVRIRMRCLALFKELILTFVLICFSTHSAQAGTLSFVGVIDNSNIYSTGKKFGPQTGIGGGLLLGFPLGSRFAFETGALYSRDLCFHLETMNTTRNKYRDEISVQRTFFYQSDRFFDK